MKVSNKDDGNMANSDYEEKKRIPLVLKLFFSFVILTFLSLSIWLKIDYFMNFNSPTVLPEVSVSPEALGSDTTGINPDLFEILNKEGISPDATAFNTPGRDGGYYTIQIGVFESPVEMEAAREAWFRAGFTELQITDKEPYILSFGKYAHRAEADLIASIIRSAADKEASILFIE